MELWIKLIDVIAWPSVILILGFSFRSEIRRVAVRLTKLKYKDLEATFDKELNTIESNVKVFESLPSAPVEDGSENIEEIPSNKPFAQILRIAEVSPRASIVEAWREIENVVTRIAQNRGMHRNAFSGANIIKKLIESDSVDKSLLDEYQRMRKLRNEAAHAEEFQISQNEAERYITIAIEMAGFLGRFEKSA